MVTAGNSSLSTALEQIVGEAGRVKTRAIDIHANAHDASHFLLLPRAVVIAKDAIEVGKLLTGSRRLGLPVTLRSGGTSLSGQSVSDGVLVDVRQQFTRVEVLDDGARVRVEPGVTVRQLNTRLRRYGRKFGPDPASESACTVGGVIANNSSGMVCGTRDNAYSTLESLTAVLASGTVIDTAAIDADGQLKRNEPAIHSGLIRIRDRIRGNPQSVTVLRQQFSMKNTMGYGLNSFLDWDTPIEILAHLLVGSEGTLGFVAESVFRTVPLNSHFATALLIFNTLEDANLALPALVDTGASSLELMDTLSLRVGQQSPDAPAAIAGLVLDQHAALLLEYQAPSAGQLSELTAGAERMLARLPLAAPTELTGDANARAELWHLRKGLYAAVAGARPTGTTALLEDIVVPVASLAATCGSLIELFDRYNYENSVIFGHAKDGNVHFMLTDGFTEPDQLNRYRAFTEELVELVLAAGGSLKAEHGTGRVMAPYVRRQYGDELYEIMREIKNLFDPGLTLNPGVILNDDPDAHVTHIKTALPVEEEVDRCVECGYCEPVCPSRNLTLTPRQRIVVRRAIAQAGADGDTRLVAELERDSTYSSVDTCAVDGMCQTACPVLINTGDLVKRLRQGETKPIENALWRKFSVSWAPVTRVASLALSAAAALPPTVVTVPNRLARAALGTDTLPLWSAELPRGGKSRKRRRPAAVPDAVYMPSCVNTMFGPAGESIGVQRSFEELCERAGVTLLVPTEIDSMCCGTPWTSKGFLDGATRMNDSVLRLLQAASDGGRLPIVCDAASCTEGLFNNLASAAPELTIIDAVKFVETRVLPLLPERQKLDTLTVHPTCSSTRIGTTDSLLSVAAEIAETVLVPDSWGCCGFAGDRGMLHPELTESATREQAQEVNAFHSSAHASCNRTCELGMTRATGKEYNHVLELLADATRPRSTS